ncbi:MAG TPA: ABC transporter ATP-binding protein [Firmicutes bacterium]|nr:ABC transporter ATP-binding protein [Bacillota bacterium]
MEKLVELKDLKTYFFTSDGVLPAVDGVSFYIGRGETLGVVGESGCGKSVTSLSIMRLIPIPPGRYVSGEIFFEGENLLKKKEEEMRKIRGNDIAMIFQEPMTSLNPVYTIGDQIAEAVQLHQGLRRREAMEKAEHMLRLVGVPDPHRRVREYPHQLSGGMRQRAMIAMALSCNPKLLIADEPTTALDVTIQAQILELMKSLKRELGMAIMLITHDLGVIAEMAERVVVMYAGKVVEEATVNELFQDPLHPYTEGLLTCIPRIDRARGRLNVIEGTVPNPLDFPEGCRFHNRCPYVQDICRVQEPPLVWQDSRRIACHFRPGERRLAKEVA